MKRLTTSDRAAEVCAWIDSGRARELRVAADNTQQDAARFCEVTQAAIHRWETAQRRPRGRNVIVYHRYLSRLARQAVAGVNSAHTMGAV